MSAQAIIFILLHTVLPELLAIGALVVAALFAWRSRSLIQGFAFAAIFLTTLWSLVIWYQIYFLGALQVSCSPLILNATGMGVFIGQLIWFTRHETVA
jgi:hypothetical protein